jgi:hypothetical protein
LLLGELLALDDLGNFVSQFGFDQHFLGVG